MLKVEEVASVIAKYQGLEKVTEDEIAKAKEWIDSGVSLKKIKKKCKRIRRWEKYLEISGKIFDGFPLKYFSSGYWSEKFARRGLKILNQFKDEVKNCMKSSENQDLENLIRKYTKKTKTNDTLMYGMFLSSSILLLWAG